MATVDELLAAETTENDDELSFLIDEHLRIITVPERGVVLGVEGDKDVNRVRFRMNRYYHGSDLSSFAIRIYYQNAEGEVNYFTVQEKTVDTDTFSFIWVVAADAVMAKGTVLFVVNCFTADSSGIVQKAYHTTLGTASVLEGLEVDVAGNQPQIVDFLGQLKNDLTVHAGTVLREMDDFAQRAAQSEDRASTYAAAAGRSASSAGQSASAAAASEQNAKASEEATVKALQDAKAIVGTDKTLTVDGAAADAKAVGLALAGVITETQIKALIADVLAEEHAKIKFWISEDSTSPAELFGGTWELIGQDRVLMGASSAHPAGTTAEAGLPNITGYTSHSATVASAEMTGWGYESDTGGAFTRVHEANWWTGYTNTKYFQGHVLELDASKSSAIYGNSNTVQPPACYVYIWRRVS